LLASMRLKEIKYLSSSYRVHCPDANKWECRQRPKANQGLSDMLFCIQSLKVPVICFK
jgi:hypothetical protein